MLVCLIISLTGILQASSAFAAELNPTKYLLKGETAPFEGYLVEPTRLEKCMIAISDLQSTKEVLALKTQYYEEKLQREKALADEKFAAQLKESEAVEKELKAKIADLDVWYKKPWFVALGTAAILITIGVLIP